MRIAVITGASSGLGKEFTRQIPRLYRHLDSIWVVARSTERLKELQAEIEKEYEIPVKVFDGDLLRDYIYERIQKELDRTHADIRMLVNCAGYGKMGVFSEGDEKEQLGMVTLNCYALTKMIKVCLPHLSGGSRIINLASAAAFSPQPGFAIYAASKSYVKSFSHGLAGELKDRGIMVTAVCPGPVDTAFFHKSGNLPGGEKALKKADPRCVVHQALVDAAKKRQVSTYGPLMKLMRVGTKLLPDAVLSEIMRVFNHI